MKKPTLKDVANEAGVSLGMASRVLGNYGSYSEETKEKVAAAVAKIGYKKNGIARSLRLNNSKTIGLVVSNISSVFWATITRAIEDCASKNGYHVIVGNTDEDPKKEREYLETFCEGYVDGIVVSPSPDNHSLLKKLFRSGMNIVTVDRKLDSNEIPSVTIDNFHGAYEAVSHLVGLGHSRIAIINGIDGIMTSDQRYAGYRQVLEEHGIEINKDLIKEGFFQKERVYDATLELLKLKVRPTALFVSNETMAMGAYGALLDKGISIGKEMDMIGFGDTDWATIVRPALSCVRQPIYPIGTMACEIVMRLINKSETTFPEMMHMCMKPELVVRDSCKRL